MGRKSVKSEPVALDDVLKSAVETLSDQMNATSARVLIPEKKPLIQGDLALSTNVFTNLIENAIKYQKANEAPVVNIGIEVEDQRVVVSVADNGIGIAPEYHEKNIQYISAPSQSVRISRNGHRSCRRQKSSSDDGWPGMGRIRTWQGKYF